jgi:ferredoxin
MVTSSSSIVAMTALIPWMIFPAHSFIVPPMARSSIAMTTMPSASDVSITNRRRANSFRLSATSDYITAQSTTNTLSLTLEKPLGLLLEEIDESGVAGGGVIVTQVNENGSAYTSSYRDALPQMKIKSVMGKDVSTFTLEDVMDVIIDAPSPVSIEFVSSSFEESTATATASSSAEMNETTPKYEVGTSVTITVQQPSETRKSDITIEAKVGDNLRKTLLSNPDIELYRGLKKKLGNCGGGGQCGFCAVEVIDADEDGKVWGKRSDYEATKIGKNGSEKTRLACLNNIAGPAIVKTL